MKYLPLLMMLSGPALADATIGDRTIECFCTDTSGSRVELGESICLQVGGRMFTAQCQMSLNVPMWRETADGCLTGALRNSDETSSDPLVVLQSTPG